MINTKSLSSIYARDSHQASAISEKTTRDRLEKNNPNFATNPLKIKKELLKRVDRKSCVDSSYYLG